jgi:SAM-dependent methyltransferase
MDLQCGPGLAAAIFGNNVPSVVAIDSAPEMIFYARSLHSANNILWVCEHPLKISNAKDVDLLYFSLDNYAYLLSDREERLLWSNIDALLSSSGMAIVEINNSFFTGYIDYSMLYSAPETLFPDYRLRVEWGLNNPTPDPLTGVCSTEIRFTESQERNTRSWSLLSQERYHWPRDISLMLELSGFRVIGFYGDFDSSPLTTTSPRVVFVTVRQ